MSSTCHLRQSANCSTIATEQKYQKRTFSVKLISWSICRWSCESERSVQWCRYAPTTAHTLEKTDEFASWSSRLSRDDNLTEMSTIGWVGAPPFLISVQGFHWSLWMGRQPFHRRHHQIIVNRNKLTYNRTIFHYRLWNNHKLEEFFSLICVFCNVENVASRILSVELGGVSLKLACRFRIFLPRKLPLTPFGSAGTVNVCKFVPAITMTLKIKDNLQRENKRKRRKEKSIILNSSGDGFQLLFFTGSTNRKCRELIYPISGDVRNK